MNLTPPMLAAAKTLAANQGLSVSDYLSRLLSSVDALPVVYEALDQDAQGELHDLIATLASPRERVCHHLRHMAGAGVGDTKDSKYERQAQTAKTFTTAP